MTEAEPVNSVVVTSGDSPNSKTRALAVAALKLGGGGRLIDLRYLPADALLGRRSDGAVEAAVAAASRASVLVLATPVYRATYNGSLKAFLDRFPSDALARTAVVLAATAASPAHFLALDTGGRAVVASLGGWVVPPSCTPPGPTSSTAARARPSSRRSGAHWTRPRRRRWRCAAPIGRGR